MSDRVVALRPANPSPAAAEPNPSTEDPRLTEALERYLAALEAGQWPDRDALAAQYPEFADKLAGCVDGLEFLHRTAAGLHADPPGDRAGAAHGRLDAG